MVGGILQDAPVVLCVDNMQDLDKSSGVLLESVLARCTKPRFFALITARTFRHEPNYYQRLKALENSEHHILGGLERKGEQQRNNPSTAL